MAQQVINVGAAPNDGTGDPLRTAMTKANANFSALWPIATQVASASATIDFTSGIDSTFNEYLFAFTNILPATNAVNFTLQVSINAGSSWITTGTYARTLNLLNGSTNTPTGIVNEPAMIVTGGLVNTTARTMSGEMRLFGPASTTTLKTFTWMVGYLDATDMNCVHGSGLQTSTAASAINGVRFAMTSGNIASGTIALYGVPKT